MPKGTREQGASSVEHVSQEWQEHFVCVSEHLPEVREENTATSQEVLLVSSPGYAVIDSGCGKTIVGEETLDGFRKIWQQQGIPVKPELTETNSFRYGNGAREVSHTDWWKCQSTLLAAMGWYVQLSSRERLLFSFRVQPARP